MTLGKKPRRYHLRPGDRYAVTPKSGRGRFTIWPAVLFIIVASVYYINTKTPGQDGDRLAQQESGQKAADNLITSTIPQKK